MNNTAESNPHVNFIAKSEYSNSRVNSSSDNLYFCKYSVINPTELFTPGEFPVPAIFAHSLARIGTPFDIGLSIIAPLCGGHKVTSGSEARHRNKTAFALTVAQCKKMSVKELALALRNIRFNYVTTRAVELGYTEELYAALFPVEQEEFDYGLSLINNLNFAAQAQAIFDTVRSISTAPVISPTDSVVIEVNESGLQSAQISGREWTSIYLAR